MRYKTDLEIERATSAVVAILRREGLSPRSEIAEFDDGIIASQISELVGHLVSAKRLSMVTATVGGHDEILVGFTRDAEPTRIDGLVMSMLREQPQSAESIVTGLDARGANAEKPHAAAG